MTRLYRVEFDTYKNRVARAYAIDVEASNMKEARKKVEGMWDSKSHMFHIAVRRLRDDEEFLYHWFKVLVCQPYQWGNK